MQGLGLQLSSETDGYHKPHPTSAADGVDEDLVISIAATDRVCLNVGSQ